MAGWSSAQGGKSDSLHRPAHVVYGQSVYRRRTPAPATINKKRVGRYVMRLKPDGTLDLDWRKQPSRLWELTKEERDEELLNSILRNHPGLTREKAQEMLNYFG